MAGLRVKICGVTRPQDAAVCVQAGASAIGMVLTERSVRCVDAAQAHAICSRIPAFVTRVALFLDDSASHVQKVLDEAPIDMLQFHGGESPSFCRQFNKPYIKAIARQTGRDELQDLYQQHAEARALLLDSHSKGQSGGTGITLNWHEVANLIEGLPPDRFILAGGLTHGNVALAALLSNIRSVDVSSGVESAPGVKDPKLVNAFMAAAHTEAGAPTNP